MDYEHGSHFKASDAPPGMMREYRASPGTSTSYRVACTALILKDKIETWLVSGPNKWMKKMAGNILFNLNENWLFNKDRKISYMMQYDQKYKSWK